MHQRNQTMDSPIPVLHDHTSEGTTGDEATTSSDTPSPTTMSTDIPEAPMDPSPSPLASIFFKDSSTSDGGYTYNIFSASPRDPHLPEPSFDLTLSPFVICSSSKGLLLSYCSEFNTYDLCNPFSDDESGYRLIPDPPRSHRYCHRAAVLSVQTAGFLAFDIICAFEEETGEYTFDWYYSRADQWFQRRRVSDIGHRRIAEQTGISDDSGIAYWLTDDRSSVIQFDTVSRSRRRRLDLGQISHAYENMQLGQLNEDDIGLVSSTGSRVFVYILDFDLETDSPEWLLYGNIDLNTVRFLNVNDEVMPPMLLRFHKDVPLWVGNRSILWEVSSGTVSPREDISYRELYEWALIPQPQFDTVPYMFPQLNPSQFTREEGGEGMPPIVGEDEQEDSEEDDEETSSSYQEGGRDFKRTRRD